MSVTDKATSMAKTSDEVGVLLIYADSPKTIWQVSLTLPAGSRVCDAIKGSDFESAFPQIAWQDGAIGIFGHLVRADHELRPGDRIEIYRPLTFDPKESRRRRAAHKRRQTRTTNKRRMT